MRSLLSLVLLLALPFPAQAIDLTGTWDGKYICRGYDGSSFSFTVRGMLEITQVGTDLALRFPFTGGADTYNGVAIPDERKPDTKGGAYFVHCGTNDVPGGGLEGFDETGNAKVKTTASGGGSLKATTTLFLTELPVGAGACKYSYKRTSTADPAVPRCDP